VITGGTLELQNQIISDPYFRDIPSINKKAKEGGYYFHGGGFVRHFPLPKFRQLLFSQKTVDTCQ